MQKLTKRTAIVETRAKNNEDDIAELRNDADKLASEIENGAPYYLGKIPRKNMIPNGSDLNSYDVPGTYGQFQGSETSNILNRPIDQARAFTLLVKYGTGDSSYTIIQTYIDYQGDEYERVSNPRSSSSQETRTWNKWKPKFIDGDVPVESGGTGWEHGLNSGINIVPGTSDEWSRWITPTPNTANFAFMDYTTYVTNIDKNIGDVYTNYVEVEFENVTATSGQTFRFQATTAVVKQGSSTWVYNQGSPWLFNQIAGNTPSNGVYKIVYHKTMTNNDYVDDDVVRWLFGFRCDYWASGRFRYRCLKIERGYVDYPQWTPAPDDIKNEISEINDMTTGINLLRGTRDIVQGSGSTVASLIYRNGFGFSGTFNRSTDKNGFTIISTNVETESVTGAYSSAIYIERDDRKYTIAFDFMVNSSGTSMPNKDTICCWIQSKNESDTAPNIDNISYSPNKLIPQCENGKWYRAVIHYTAASNADFFYIILRWQRPGVISFMMPRIFEGHIVNPEWSASPFDIAQQIDLNGFNGMIKSENMLKSGDDLDEIMKYDVYGCHTYTIAKTLKNIPPTLETAFIMHVESANGMSNTYRQRIVALNSIVMTNPRVFIRYKQDGVNGGAWTPWSETYTYTTVRPIEGGGTGGITVEEARNNLKIGQLVSSTSLIPSGGFSAFEDKVSYWKKLQSGNYWSQNPNIDGHWGFLTHLKDTESGQYSFQTAQLFFDVSENSLSYRTNNNSTESALFPHFSKIATFDLPSPYNSGLYGGTSIADKFKREIGSNHIANFLSSRASQGNFDGLNIGDWVDIACTGATRRYVIAGINVWRDSGNPTRLGNHIVFVLSGIWRLSSSRDGSYAVGNNSECISWSNSSSNNGTASESSPYLASNLHKWESEVAIKQFPQEWQDVMINRYDLVEVRYSASSTLTSSNGIKWVNLGKLWSLSEVDLYGTKIVSQNQACVNAQLPLFANINNRQKYSNRISYWLRDVANNDSSQACLWTYTGTASIYPVNRQDCYPYPCFLLG